MIENYDLICHLTETGCINCNRIYSDFILNSLDHSRVLVIVSARGTLIDISEFRNFRTDIIFDENDFSKLNILNTSGAIVLKNKKVDSVIQLSNIDLEEQLNYLMKYRNQ